MNPETPGVPSGSDFEVQAKWGGSSRVMPPLDLTHAAAEGWPHRACPISGAYTELGGGHLCYLSRMIHRPWQRNSFSR